jgi:hypothetical protein
LLAESARDALLRLTGETHWTDVAVWKAWWTENSENFEPAPLDDAEFKKRHAELLAKLGDGLGGGIAAQFYGKKVKGKNILFLLDASGSMEEEGRMDRLKNELSHMIEQMEESFSFGFVMFPLDTFPSRGIEPADKRMKDRAARFIERLSPKGGTPMAQALRFAFEKIVTPVTEVGIFAVRDLGVTETVGDDHRAVARLFSGLSQAKVVARVTHGFVIGKSHSGQILSVQANRALSQGA